MAAPTFFSGKGGGGPSVVKEYEIITLKYNGNRLQVIFFIF